MQEISITDDQTAYVEVPVIDNFAPVAPESTTVLIGPYSEPEGYDPDDFGFDLADIELLDLEEQML